VLHSQVRIDTLNRVMEQFRQDHQLPDAPWSPEQLCALHEAMQGIRHDLQDTLDRLENEIAQIEQALVRRSKIVATTLTRTYTSRLLDDQRFDTVIIDEASMALAPALFCTLALATSRVIIVGDFLQLAPIASAKTPATKQWLARSIYDLARDHLRPRSSRGAPQHAVPHASRHRERQPSPLRPRWAQLRVRSVHIDGPQPDRRGCAGTRTFSHLLQHRTCSSRHRS
jgi:hypothetical protein